MPNQIPVVFCRAKVKHLMEITEGLKNKVASFPNPPASKINSKETYKQDTSPFLKEGTKGTIFMSFKKKKKTEKNTRRISPFI